MALLRNIFWVALFVLFTFLWVVLLQNGPSKFSESASAEMKNFKEFMGMGESKKPVTAPGAPGAPAPAPR